MLSDIILHYIILIYKGWSLSSLYQTVTYIEGTAWNQQQQLQFLAALPWTISAQTVKFSKRRSNQNQHSGNGQESVVDVTATCAAAEKKSWKHNHSLGCMCI